MKIQELFEMQETEVKLSDLYIFQDNEDANSRYVDKLVTKIEDGEELEPVLVLPLTAKFKRELQALKQKLAGMPTHKKYAEGIEDAIFSSTKKYILLDGNHRYLAAMKAKLKKLPAEIDTMSAEDYVDYIFQEF